MKILIIRETELSEISPEVMNTRGLAGTENSVVCLAQELSKKHIVKVCCPISENKFFGQTEYIPFRGYTDTFLKACIFSPDVIIVSGNPGIFFGVPNLPAKKCFFWQQNHPHELIRFPMDLLVYKIPIVAPSKEAETYYRTFYQRGHFYGIYNGIRKEFFNVTSDRIKDKITYVGSFTRAKGLSEVLLVAKSLSQYQFYLCGSFDLYGFVDVEYKKFCESIARDCKNIHFMGSLNGPRLAQELCSSTLCIVNPLVGNKETCCVSALESMATGTPVIAGGDSIIDPIVSRGGVSHNGNLKLAVEDLMINKGQRDLLGDSGKHFASGLSWSKMAKDWENILLEGVH